MLNLNENKELKNEKLGKSITSFITNFLKELEERLRKMEEILVVDRIEGNMAICENRKSKKMQNIPLSILPEDIKEGSVLIEKQGKYEIDESSNIEKRIEQKMKDLWN